MLQFMDAADNWPDQENRSTMTGNPSYQPLEGQAGSQSLVWRELNG